MTSDFNKTTIQRTFTSPNSAFRTLFKDEPVDEFDGNAFTKYSGLTELAENTSLGIKLFKYDVDIYPGYGNGMLFERGIFVYRDDGSASEGIQYRWRNSAHVWPSIKEVTEISHKNNHVIANIKFSDGSVKPTDLGLEKSPEAYFVFRNNASYNTLMDSLSHNIQDEDVVFKSMIFFEGTDIVENDDIRSIPDDALIFTDRAALDACPSLKHKSVKRLDEMIDSYYGSYPSFGVKFKEAVELSSFGYDKPDKILVYLPNLADHPEVGSENHIKFGDVDLYSDFLQKNLSLMYNLPKEDIIFTNDPKRIEKRGYKDLAIVDRHASKNFEYESTYTESIKLPLYENFNGRQSSSDGLFTDLAKDIVKIVVDKYKK